MRAVIKLLAVVMMALSALATVIATILLTFGAIQAAQQPSWAQPSGDTGQALARALGGLLLSGAVWLLADISECLHKVDSSN